MSPAIQLKSEAVILTNSKHFPAQCTGGVPTQEKTRGSAFFIDTTKYLVYWRHFWWYH
jgi:hypothetical protein